MCGTLTDLGDPFLQVNRTFEELALLRDIQEVWGMLGPQLFGFLNNSANVAMLQVGLGWRLGKGRPHSRQEVGPMVSRVEGPQWLGLEDPQTRLT